MRRGQKSYVAGIGSVELRPNKIKGRGKGSFGLQFGTKFNTKRPADDGLLDLFDKAVGQVSNGELEHVVLKDEEHQRKHLFEPVLRAAVPGPASERFGNFTVLQPSAELTHRVAHVNGRNEKRRLLPQVDASHPPHLCANIDVDLVEEGHAGFLLFRVRHIKHFEPVRKITAAALDGFPCGDSNPGKNVQ